jgi:uncharacterized protein (DUF1697 family)
MPVYISFLRGVNMTGHNKIKMDDLANLFINIGFSDVETYIQSGNVVFKDAGVRKENELAALIESGIRKKLGYEIPAMVRTPGELRATILNNPFNNIDSFDPSKLAVIFLYNLPSESQIEKVKNISYPPDQFIIIGREIYIYCPNGFGRTKLYTNFFENKMKIVGTARNWKSINNILRLSERK